MKNETFYLLLGVAALIVAVLFLKKRRVGSETGTATETTADIFDAFTAPISSAHQISSGVSGGTSTVYAAPVKAPTAAQAYATADAIAASGAPGTPEQIAAANAYEATETVMPGYQAPLPSRGGEINTPLYVGDVTSVATGSGIGGVLAAPHWQAALPSFNGQTNTPLWVA